MRNQSQFNSLLIGGVPGLNLVGSQSSSIFQRLGRINRRAQDLANPSISGLQADAQEINNNILSIKDSSPNLLEQLQQDVVLFPNSNQIITNRHGVFIPQSILGENVSIECETKKLRDGSIQVQISSCPNTASSESSTYQSLAKAVEVSLEIDWVNKHKHEYVDQWVALDGDRLLAHGTSAREVYEQARQLGVIKPFLLRMASAEEELPFGGW